MNDIWEYYFLGNTVRDWAISTGIIIVAITGIYLFKRVIIAQLNKIAARTRTNFDDLLIRVINSTLVPLAFVYAVYFGLFYLQLSTRIEQIVRTAILFATTFFIIRAVTSLVAYAFESALNRSTADNETKKPAKGILLIINIVVWVLGLVFIIDNLGYDITTIVTGLGIGGIAIALASQAVLGDLFSYIVIFFDKPFEIGDFIIVEDKMGTVEYVGIKTTRIRSLSGEQLICSNTYLTNARVHNYKRMQERRVVFGFGILYETPADLLQQVPEMVKDIIVRTEGTRFDRAHFKSFAAFSLDFEVVYYVLSPDYNVYMDIQQQINFAIFNAFKQASVEFAYPTHTVLVHTKTP